MTDKHYKADCIL